MAVSETESHLRLKRLALQWAQANGFAISATEVRVLRVTTATIPALERHRGTVAMQNRGACEGRRQE